MLSNYFSPASSIDVWLYTTGLQENINVVKILKDITFLKYWKPNVLPEHKISFLVGALMLWASAFLPLKEFFFSPLEKKIQK